MVKQIPNMITGLNLLCGAVAILFTISGDLILAASFVVLGVIFDFCDGLVARLLNAQSEVGVQLDSLADMVTFGVVPGFVMYKMIEIATLGSGYTWQEKATETMFLANGKMNLLPFVGLIIILGAAYRLAKFNVDTRQTTSFIGLPTPANALLILSLPLIFEFQYTHVIADILFNKWFLVGLSIVSALLMNLEIHLFAFKFKTWDIKSNLQRYVFLALCILLLVVFQFIAIPIIVLLYIIISVVWRSKD